MSPIIILPLKFDLNLVSGCMQMHGQGFRNRHVLLILNLCMEIAWPIICQKTLRIQQMVTKCESGLGSHTKSWPNLSSIWLAVCLQFQENCLKHNRPGNDGYSAESVCDQKLRLEPLITRSPTKFELNLINGLSVNMQKLFGQWKARKLCKFRGVQPKANQAWGVP